MISGQAGHTERFPEPQRPCSPVRETQPAATPASPRRPARVRFPQRGTGTKPLHTQWPGSARGAVCSLAPRAAALTSGQRGSVIDRHPDLLHPALSQFQRHFRSCTRRPATPGGSDLGRRAVADPPRNKGQEGCVRLHAAGRSLALLWKMCFVRSLGGSPERRHETDEIGAGLRLRALLAGWLIGSVQKLRDAPAQ